MIGWSRPKSLRIDSTVSFLASGPAIMVAGSAGATCIKKKHRNRTPTNAGTEITRRWIICRPMKFLHVYKLGGSSHPPPRLAAGADVALLRSLVGMVRG